MNTFLENLIAKSQTLDFRIFRIKKIKRMRSRNTYLDVPDNN
mgnify:CR=1 FL=1